MERVSRVPEISRVSRVPEISRVSRVPRVSIVPLVSMRVKQELNFKKIMLVNCGIKMTEENHIRYVYYLTNYIHLYQRGGGLG